MGPCGNLNCPFCKEKTCTQCNGTGWRPCTEPWGALCREIPGIKEPCDCEAGRLIKSKHIDHAGWTSRGDCAACREKGRNNGMRIEPAIKDARPAGYTGKVYNDENEFLGRIYLCHEASRKKYGFYFHVFDPSNSEKESFGPVALQFILDSMKKADSEYLGGKQ